MALLDKYLVQSCSIVQTSRNSYGDYIYQILVSEPCRLREISTIRRNAHQEVNDSDAMLWLSPTTAAVKGSIILFDGVYYQIERIIKARKLDDATVHFVKCELKITDIAIS